VSVVVKVTNAQRLTPKGYSSLTYIALREQARPTKNNETKTRFIELRAQGLPLREIAAKIKVSKTT